MSLKGTKPNSDGEPIKTYIQVSDFILHIGSYTKQHKQIDREFKLFLLDFMPNLQHIMDYDACVEALLQGGFEEYVFAATSDDAREQLSLERMVEKYELTEYWNMPKQELTPENK